jgi:hypothetical protein
MHKNYYDDIINIDNKKKLLCYNVVNYGSCLYKNKCLFAHHLNEQKKENIRELIFNIIYNISDLSDIYLNDDKELLNELILYTKECKNCINNKCPGGYNCKYGVCKKEMRLCYNDLMNGKCKNDVIKNNNITKCINGIHLTEKKLIPYNERIHGEYTYLNESIMNNKLINYNYKLNTISIVLNDETIKITKNIIDKNFKNLIKNINKPKNTNTYSFYNISKQNINNDNKDNKDNKEERKGVINKMEEFEYSSDDEIIKELLRDIRGGE